MSRIDADASAPHAGPTPAPLGRRTWTAIVIMGLVGQVAWVIENLYLNLFVYETITDNPNAIALMVAVSAVTATTAAFVVGAWSDRRGTRRPFIVTGYVLWGLSTMAFGLASAETVARWVPAASAVTAAVVAVVLIDALMSFLGGGANDASFNAWVTDTTDVDNRGRVEGVLQVLPLVALLLVFGALDPLTKAGAWNTFFVVVGAVVVLAGLGALLLVRDSPKLAREHAGMFRAMLGDLTPTAVRGNPWLYLALAALGLIGISSQVVMPFLIIYIQHYLRIDAYALVLAVVVLGSAVAGVLGGRVIDRIGKVRAMPLATAIYVVGLLLVYPARGITPLIAAGLVFMSGSILVTAAIAAAVRDYTPLDRAGAVQGLRMVFFVLIPMIIGPFIGAAVIRNADQTYEDLGQVRQVPTPGIFLAAAAVGLFALVPMLALRRHEVRAGPAKPEGAAPDG